MGTSTAQKGNIPLNRLLTATSLSVLAVCAVIDRWIFIAVIVALTVGGLYEFFTLIKKKGIPIYSYVGIPIGVLIPISIFWHFELTKNWELLFTILAFLIIILMQFVRRDNSNATVGISTTIFGVLYVSWFFSFLVKIRMMFPGVDGEGVKLLAFILLVTKAGDIGAYLIGIRYGKHPLLPRISPNKSIEGCIGSLVFSVVFAVLAKGWLPGILDFSLLHVALMGAIFGCIGQLGDLSESLIKRDCNVKDSGNILPGMGGVLDVIDSLLFSAPAFYLYISAVSNTL
ncbi:MAG TPA: phosphatidate cytidylyltransferase [Candidatus Omnitrophota bacterium]|nr:phosphatidate cytidylyltransferase [Candidatus Omnitrophota bacterium]HPD85007.1 phosphatidate cytidylyltransferase [Candidatus Omnitrophota bacterium]HRZ03865.1 phosphatidate cytidylyltransferase [Candidatus Omnitrophota bacterium]